MRLSSQPGRHPGSSKPGEARNAGPRGIKGAKRKRNMKKVLLWPSTCRRSNKLFHTLNRLGALVTTEAGEEFTSGFLWHYGTVLDIPVPDHLRRNPRFHNLGGIDVRKSRVDAIFFGVFAWRSIIQYPDSHWGTMVEKSENQCAHDGQIIRGPISNKKSGKIYQMLIDNRVDNGKLEEMRFSFIKGKCIYAWKKFRPGSDMFGQKCRCVLFRHPLDIVDRIEMKNLELFVLNFDTPYCEIDVLRHSDGKIYVIDVNNVAGTLYSSGLSRKEVKWMKDTYDQAFEAAYL